MQKIIPHLWFDTQAKAAAQFYVETFKDARVQTTVTLSGTPSGTVDIVTIEVWGQEFTLLNAGPYFKLNPSVSFLIACQTQAEVEELWGKLAPGGTPLMELGSYPFSEKYGWIQDKYGVSWQVMCMGERKITQRIIPTMMFVGEQCGKAEAAITFYTSIFHHAKVGDMMRYTEGEEPDIAGTIKHAAFTLEGQEFAAMDSAHKHDFAFNEAISFIVNCENQAEVDYFWDKLSADPKAEQCGWLKDKYGFSWQIEPIALTKMLEDKDPEKVARVSEALLKMKKFDIAALETVYQGKN